LGRRGRGLGWGKNPKGLGLLVRGGEGKVASLTPPPPSCLPPSCLYPRRQHPYPFTPEGNLEGGNTPTPYPKGEGRGGGG